MRRKVSEMKNTIHMYICKFTFSVENSEYKWSEMRLVKYASTTLHDRGGSEKCKMKLKMCMSIEMTLAIVMESESGKKAII